MLKFYFWHWRKHTFIPIYNEIGILGTFLSPIISYRVVYDAQTQKLILL